MKLSGKFFIVLLLAFALVGLSGCAETGKASEEDAKKTEEAKANTEKEQKNNPKNEEEQVNDFVLKNTKIVKIFNISKRINDKHPDLGPFFVIRGIDERGQKSEIWIKDMKIFEMVNSN